MPICSLFIFIIMHYLMPGSLHILVTWLQLRSYQTQLSYLLILKKPQFASLKTKMLHEKDQARYTSFIENKMNDSGNFVPKSKLPKYVMNLALYFQKYCVCISAIIQIENSTSKNSQKWNEMTAYTIHEVGNNLELIRLLWATIVNLLLNGGARIDPNKFIIKSHLN